MKKLIITSICIITLCFIVSFAVLPTIKGKDTSDNIKNNTTLSSINSSYIVKSFNGNVAVFECDDCRPFKITDVPINSLPYTDQEMLKKGIAVNSKNELNKLLEDYCS